MSINHYPEHLNPFAEDVKPKATLRISNSFRELKNTLRKSFRIKKRKEPTDEVEIRKKTDYVRPSFLSYPNNATPTIALPRSRFHERVSKTTIEGPNPFDDGGRGEDHHRTAPRRRGKKKAPMPPISRSSQNITGDHLNDPPHASHWSLTSADTDYSYSTDNVSTLEYHEDFDKLSITDKFVDFNREMEKLNDDDDNNNSIVKSAERESNVPDLVASCPSSDTEEKTREENYKVTLPDEETTPEEESKSDDIDLTLDIENNIHTDDDFGKEQKPEAFLYYENKSLYITGSRDELNESNKVSLYITGSREELDYSNNNKYEETLIEENLCCNNGDDIPVPTLRRHKLVKTQPVVIVEEA